jgi:predicted metal-dependent phosphoesterase TrpH
LGHDPVDTPGGPRYTAPELSGGTMLVDLHVHSCRSKDSLSRPEELIMWMGRRGVDVIAVTDHDAIDGAYEAARLAPGAVIIGEEIRTDCGEIIGLFLRDHIPPGRSPEETVERIHDQGGLVYVPHPTDHLRGSTLTAVALERIVHDVDLIEVFNARVMRSVRNREARALAECRGLLMGAGSDAHRARDIGLATVDMPGFTDAESFLAALPHGHVSGRLTDLHGRLCAWRARAFKRVLRSSEVKATCSGR